MGRALLWFATAFIFVVGFGFTLGFPTASMVENEAFRDILQAAFLALIVWALFKYSRPFFSWFLPAHRRYEPTIQSRKIQGAIAEVVMFGAGFFITLVVLMVLRFTYFHFSTSTGLNEFYAEQAEDYQEYAIIDSLWNRNSTFIREYLEKYGEPQPDTGIKAWVAGPEKAKYDAIMQRTEEITRKYDKFREENSIDYSWKDYATWDEDFFNFGYAAGYKFYDTLPLNKYLNPSYITAFAFDTIDNLWWLFYLVVIGLFLAGYFATRDQVAKFFKPFIRFFETGRFGLGGSGRFAGLAEEWDMLYKTKGKNTIYLGESMYASRYKIGIEDDRHMFTIGGSRGGKGVSAVIPNLILWPGSVVVIDPKAVNTIVTAERRKEFGGVHVIDPFQQATKHLNGMSSASINPLELIDKTSFRARDDIKRLASALVIRNTGTKDPHWDDEAETVIAAMIAHIMSKRENPHLGMLSEMVYQSPDDMEELWLDMAVNYDFESLARNAALGRLEASGTDESKSVMVNVRKHVDWLGGGPTVDAIKASSFHLPDIKKEPTSLYIVVPYEMLEVQSRFVRLIINTVINQMTVGGRSKQPVLMVMDEFLALGYMKEIKKAIAVLAEYGLVLWPIVQELTSMEEIYGQNLSPFFTNSRAVQVFAISDEKSKDYVSKELGARGIAKLLANSNSNQTVPFRTPDELEKEISREGGLQYVLMAGKAPMLLKKTPYFSSSYFSGKYKPDPHF